MYVKKRLGVIGAEIDGLDLEKNDEIFRKKSLHVFCKQIYQIHHCKYENDHPHHCKYLPIFISFTIDNVVDNKFV